MKKNIKKKITKNSIIEATLELINEKNGSSEVTIRDIAQKLNCSHPNIYNYYKSLGLLKWDCIEAIMTRMVDTVMASVENLLDSKEKMSVFFASLLDFYINNRGWYILLWFDPIQAEMPEKIKQVILMPRKQFCLFLERIYPEYDLTNEAEEITDTVNSYIHGQMAKFVTGRSFFPDLDILKRRTMAMAIEMIEIFVKLKGIKVENEV